MAGATAGPGLWWRLACRAPQGGPRGLCELAWSVHAPRAGFHHHREYGSHQPRWGSTRDTVPRGLARSCLEERAERRGGLSGGGVSSGLPGPSRDTTARLVARHDFLQYRRADPAVAAGAWYAGGLRAARRSSWTVYTLAPLDPLSASARHALAALPHRDDRLHHRSASRHRGA